MQLQTYLSCWANEVDLPQALECFREWRYDGIEGPPPADRGRRKEAAAQMKDGKVSYIAEIATGGNYVPAPGMSVQAHLDDIEYHLDERIADFEPVFVNVLGGSDRWSFAESLEFFGRGIELVTRRGYEVCWETHRSRPTFNPWVTRDLLVELPDMRINCDFSHWCAVCERLVMDEEADILELCSQRCGHLHARVGYDQGPQVPDPRDPFYGAALAAHLRWWQQLWDAAEQRGQANFTAAPEFGPDGYLQCSPFGGEPAADLHEVNSWMSQILRHELPDQSITKSPVS